LLRSAGAGFGYVALAGLLGSTAPVANAETRDPANPLAPKRPNFKPQAKPFIFLFMEGAMSGMDTFEYKPELQRSNGKSAPGGGLLNASRFQFKTVRQDRLMVFGADAEHRYACRRSLLAAWPAHGYTGASAGCSATAYGKRECCVDAPKHGLVAALWSWNGEPGLAWICRNQSNSQLWRRGQLRQRLSASVLPGHECKRSGLHAERASRKSARTRDRAARSDPNPNRELAASAGAPDAVEGVIKSYELGFRMQDKVPDLLDISKEPQKVLDAYGVKPGPEGSFARQCLTARRLSEAGVRFVEIRQPVGITTPTCIRG